MLSYLNPLPQLSKFRGPYQVGSTEFEIPVSEIQSSSAVPDARVTTVKFRVFYPTTHEAKSKKSIPWLPEPHRIWNQAYAQFMGISERKAGWLSYLPSLLNHPVIHAVQNAKLLDVSNPDQYPVVIFSHGLGGNYNTYSSVLGSLASCGVVCVAPEHRDGSAPTALIKSSRDKVETTIPYLKLAHAPNVEVLNGRNEMLRVRLWELELAYSAISRLNQGIQLTNFADTVSESSPSPSFHGLLNLNPSRVTWAGHSFGSATTLQFVKAVYYHQYAPKPQSDLDSEGWNMTPLYTPAANGELVQQITPESPVALLDLWTMPLRGATTSWLWERPMPCYASKSPRNSPSVVAIISTEFFKYTDLLNRTRAVLSKNPITALEAIQEQHHASSKRPSYPDKSREPTTSTSNPSSADQTFHEPTEPELTPIRSASGTDLTDSSAAEQPQPDTSTSTSTSTSTPTGTRTRTPTPPPSTITTTPKTSSLPPSPTHLYTIPQTAHLSQSDFGPLFPNLLRYFLKAQDPEKTIDLNVRAILALMSANGLPVRDLDGHTDGLGSVLGDGADRFVRLSLDAQ